MAGVLLRPGPILDEGRTLEFPGGQRGRHPDPAHSGRDARCLVGCVSQADVDLGFRFTLDQAASGNCTYMYTLVRRLNSTNAYRPKLRIASDGSVWLQASSFVTGLESSVAPQRRVTGLTATPGRFGCASAFPVSSRP